MKSNTANLIARRIEDLVLDGTLAPGKKMTSERLLASQLGVSRTALREAIKVLHGRGILSTKHGRGSFVNDSEKAKGHHPMLRSMRENKQTIFELLEVREGLEAQAAQLAAQRASAVDLANIGRAYRAVSAHLPELDDYQLALLDHQFHHAIVVASHNPVLIHTIESLQELLRQSVFTSVLNLYHCNETRERFDRQHRLIYKAIVDRNPKRARTRAAAHVRSIFDDLMALDKQKSGSIKTGI